MKQAVEIISQVVGSGDQTTSKTTKLPVQATTTRNPSCDANCHACQLITAIPASYTSASNCPLETVVTDIYGGSTTRCGDAWTHEKICRDPISGNAISNSTTKYVGASFDAYFTSCASWMKTAASPSHVALTGLDGFCRTEHYTLASPTFTSNSQIATVTPTVISSPTVVAAATTTSLPTGLAACVHIDVIKLVVLFIASLAWLSS